MLPVTGGTFPLTQLQVKRPRHKFLPTEGQSGGSILIIHLLVSGLCLSLRLSQSGGSILSGLFCPLDLKLTWTRCHCLCCNTQWVPQINYQLSRSRPQIAALGLRTRWRTRFQRARVSSSYIACPGPAHASDRPEGTVDKYVGKTLLLDHAWSDLGLFVLL